MLGQLRRLSRVRPRKFERLRPELLRRTRLPRRVLRVRRSRSILVFGNKKEKLQRTLLMTLLRGVFWNSADLS